MRPIVRAVAATALAAALLLPASPAPAESPFALDGFAAVAPGTTLAFRHRRELRPEGEAARTVFEQDLALAVEPGEAGGVAVRVRAEGGEGGTEAPFAAEVGHPMLLLFLESTVRTMAAATGGSPDYIRTRLREALWQDAEGEAATARLDGADLPARRLIYRPFAEDPHRDAMGPFAALELAFLVADGVPGGLVGLAAETAPGEGDFPGLYEAIALEAVTPAE